MPGIVLGFDFGTRRIGIAVGQPLTRSATPVATLTHKNNLHKDFNWSEIDRLVKEWQPELFVVGLPLNADGTDNKITLHCREFGVLLQNRYQINTQWIDERLTSAEAERLINIQSGKNRGGRLRDKGEIDKVAAKLIVESWFNQKTPE